MKRFYKYILLLIITIASNDISGQVSKLNYLLEFNQYDSTYSVYIKIIEGSSITQAQRVQYNAQISLVTPYDIKYKNMECFMPVKGNNFYNGTTPAKWDRASYVSSPKITPLLDYTSITPVLSPTAFYNDIKPGDEVKLFSFKVEPQPANPEEIRFFDNEKDPNFADPGMEGGDFKNMFTLGGIENDYAGNLATRIVNINPLSASNVNLIDINVYPNPVSNVCKIQTKESIQKYEVMNAEGKMILAGNSSEINFAPIASGIYYIHIYTSSGKGIKKVIKQ